MFPVEDMKFSPGFIYLTPQPPTPPNKDMLSSGIVKKSI